MPLPFCMVQPRRSRVAGKKQVFCAEGGQKGGAFCCPSTGTSVQARPPDSNMAPIHLNEDAYTVKQRTPPSLPGRSAAAAPSNSGLGPPACCRLPAACQPACVQPAACLPAQPGRCRSSGSEIYKTRRETRSEQGLCPRSEDHFQT